MSYFFCFFFQKIILNKTSECFIFIQKFNPFSNRSLLHYFIKTHKFSENLVSWYNTLKLQNCYFIYQRENVLKELQTYFHVTVKIYILISLAALQRCSLEKGVLRLWSKSTREHPYQSVISIQLLCSFD